MLDILYKVSIGVTSVLLLVLVVLISVIGCEEIVLTVLGWVTVPFLLAAVVTYILKKQKR